MRNGSIAVGFGILIIGILAVEGKLAAIWSAIMHGTTAGGNIGQNLGSAVYDPSKPAAPPSLTNPIGQNLGSGVYTPPITVPAVAGPGERYPIPVSGSNPAFDQVAFHWPAGYEQAWQQFLGCYRQNGSIAACAGWIHSDIPKG